MTKQNEQAQPPSKTRKKSPSLAESAKNPPKRKIRSKKVIHALLVEAAREEFKQAGYVGATTAAIARRAQVTETQLFRHFPSKSELFRAAVFEPLIEHFTEFNQRTDVPMSLGLGNRDLAQQYVDELRSFLGEHSKLLLSLVVAQIFQTGDLKVLKSDESLEQYFKQGAELMSRRVTDDDDLDPNLLVRLSFAGLMGCILFKDWFVPEGLADEEAVNKAMVNFVLDGIALKPKDQKSTD